MKTDDHLISKLFDVEVQFAVPRFQREYVWEEEEHWAPLWEEVEDISRRMCEGEEVEPYYLGAIVIEPKLATGFRPHRYGVVDGQQRLTTLQILFAALRDIGVERGFPRQKFLNAITENALVERELPTDQFKVWPTDADQEVFSQIMRRDRGDEVETLWPKSRREPRRPRLVEAYSYFRKQILDYAVTDDSRLEVPLEEVWKRLELLLCVLREKLHIVSIELGEQDDPMMIFEALNGRARPLLPSDLIKNFALRRAPEQDVERLYTKYWKPFDDDIERNDDRGARFWKRKQKRGRLLRSRMDLFLTDFVRSRRSPEMKDADLFKEFKAWWESGAATPEERFSIVRNDASAYRKLIAPNPGNGDPLAEFCVQLQFMDITVMHPLLLRLMHERKLPADELPRILQALESFLVRRHVCDLTKKKHNHVAATLIKTINRVVEESATLECTSISEELLNLDGPSVEWPDDEKFGRAWMENPLYKQPPTGFVRVILGRIDRWLRREYSECGVTVDYSKMTIEHVLPQDWRENYPLPATAQIGEYRGEVETAEARRNRMVQTIGNLTLLGQPLNSAISNAAFEQKRRALVEQNSVRLNAYFVDHAKQWDEAAILERAQSLFSIAKAIWPFPLDDGASVPATPAAAGPEAEIARAHRGASHLDRPRLVPIAHDSAAENPSVVEIPQAAPLPRFTKNPFRAGTAYAATVEALNTLGIGKMHDFDAILREVRAAMGPKRWTEFERRPPRNENGLGADERVIQNVFVLARRDYGESLRNQGYEVRGDRKTRMAGLFKLPSQPIGNGAA